MKRSSEDLCERLDDFLDGDLPPQEAAEFDAHLSGCAACRDAVQQQHWIDGLLSSREAAELQALPTPPVLPVRKQARKRVLIVAMAAAAACVAALPLLPRGEELGDGRPSVASLNPQPSTLDAAKAEARARAAAGTPSPSSSPLGNGAFVSSGSSIAISVPSDNPQVTIVQLYPTVTASRRWAREAELRRNSLPPNGG